MQRSAPQKRDGRPRTKVPLQHLPHPCCPAPEQVPDLPYHPSSYTSDLRNLTHPKLHQVMTLPPSRVARNHPARGSRPTLLQDSVGRIQLLKALRNPFFEKRSENRSTQKLCVLLESFPQHEAESELHVTQTLRMKCGSNLSTVASSFRNFKINSPIEALLVQRRANSTSPHPPKH